MGISDIVTKFNLLVSGHGHEFPIFLVSLSMTFNSNVFNTKFFINMYKHNLM